MLSAVLLGLILSCLKKINGGHLNSGNTLALAKVAQYIIIQSHKQVLQSCKISSKAALQT